MTAAFNLLAVVGGLWLTWLALIASGELASLASLAWVIWRDNGVKATLWQSFRAASGSYGADRVSIADASAERGRFGIWRRAREDRQ